LRPAPAGRHDPYPDANAYAKVFGFGLATAFAYAIGHACVIVNAHATGDASAYANAKANGNAYAYADALVSGNVIANAPAEPDLSPAAIAISYPNTIQRRGKGKASAIPLTGVAVTAKIRASIEVCQCQSPTADHSVTDALRSSPWYPTR